MVYLAFALVLVFSLAGGYAAGEFAVTQRLSKLGWASLGLFLGGYAISITVFAINGW